MKKLGSPGSDYLTYKVSEGGIQLQLIASTRKLISKDFLTSMARYCDKVSESGREPFIDVHQAKELWLAGEIVEARKLLNAIEFNYPEFLTAPQYLIPAGGIAIEANDRAAMETCLAALDPLMSRKDGAPELLQLLKFVLAMAIYSDRNLPVFTVRLTELKAKLQHANLMGELGSDPIFPHLSADPDDLIRDRVLEISHTAKNKWLTSGPKKIWRSSEIIKAKKMIEEIKKIQPACWSIPQFLLPAGGIAIEMRDLADIKSCLAAIESLTAGQSQVSELVQLLKISIILGLNSNFSSPDFSYRFRELKAKLQHASLVGPLASIPVMPEFRSKSGV